MIAPLCLHQLRARNTLHTHVLLQMEAYLSQPVLGNYVWEGKRLALSLSLSCLAPCRLACISGVFCLGLSPCRGASCHLPTCLSRAHVSPAHLSLKKQEERLSPPESSSREVLVWLATLAEVTLTHSGRHCCVVSVLVGGGVAHVIPWMASCLDAKQVPGPLVRKPSRLMMCEGKDLWWVCASWASRAMPT